MINILIYFLLLLICSFIMKRIFNKFRQNRIQDALFRQQVEEYLVRQNDCLNPEKSLEHKNKDKLNGLH